MAIKSISKIKFASASDHENMMTEVDLMMRVRGHPNVINLIECFEDRHAFWIVCELANGGEVSCT